MHLHLLLILLNTLHCDLREAGVEVRGGRESEGKEGRRECREGKECHIKRLRIRQRAVKKY